MIFKKEILYTNMFYTNTFRDDGFGAQFQSLICEILFVQEYLKEQFVFTPHTTFAHNYNNDPHFTEKLTKYMKVHELYLTKDENMELYKVSNGDIGKTYREIEATIARYYSSKTFLEIKNYFYKDKANPYNSKFFNIAIHIRRHNKCDVGDWGTITPDTYYLKMIHQIRNDFKDKPLKFHIYSQGDEVNFSLFTAPDTVFHLNEDILDTFSGLIFADILTTTTSSLSYVAALLSKGIIYHQPFWHKPLTKWRIIEKD
jgi:hypothetical protein